jgi:hypothetical protein
MLFGFKTIKKDHLTKSLQKRNVLIFKIIGNGSHLVFSSKIKMGIS